MKVTLLVHVENRTKKEKKRTLPLGSSVGLGRQFSGALKSVYISNFVFIFFAFDIHCYTFAIKSITVWK